MTFWSYHHGIIYGVRTIRVYELIQDLPYLHNSETINYTPPTFYGLVSKYFKPIIKILPHVMISPTVLLTIILSVMTSVTSKWYNQR